MYTHSPPLCSSLLSSSYSLCFSSQVSWAPQCTCPLACPLLPVLHVQQSLPSCRPCFMHKAQTAASEPLSEVCAQWRSCDPAQSPSSSRLSWVRTVTQGPCPAGTVQHLRGSQNTPAGWPSTCWIGPRAQGPWVCWLLTAPGKIHTAQRKYTHRKQGPIFSYLERANRQITYTTIVELHGLCKCINVLSWKRPTCKSYI